MPRRNIYGEGWLGMFGGHPGDMRNALGGDKYAIGRTASKGLPFPLSLIANLGINKAERNSVDKYENTGDFTGPPRNYNTGKYLPPKPGEPVDEEAARLQAMKDDFNRRFQVTQVNPGLPPLPTYGASARGGKGFGWAKGDPESMAAADYFANGPQFARQGGLGQIANDRMANYMARQTR